MVEDMITRGITRDGFFKAAAAVTTQVAETARTLHHASPTASAALGRLLTAALLMGEDLKEPEASLTLQIRGGGPLGLLVARADSRGGVKGYVTNPETELPLRPDGKLDVGGAVGRQGTLGVIRDLRLKEPYVGQVPLQTGEIGDDLAYYFMQSEQIPSVAALGVLVDRDRSVRCAGGFLIQVMPGCDTKSLRRLENSIKGLTGVTQLLDRGLDSRGLLEYAMLGFDLEILEEHPVSYRCGCSRDRMERALVSLGKEELLSMLEEQGQAEIVCQFCNTAYQFSGEELEMLSNAAKSKAEK